MWSAVQNWLQIPAKNNWTWWTTFDLRQLEFLFLLSSNGLKTLMKKINHNNFSTSYINDHIVFFLFPPINLQPISHLEAGAVGASIICTRPASKLHISYLSFPYP